MGSADNVEFGVGCAGPCPGGDLDSSVVSASVFLRLPKGCPGGVGSKLFLAGARRARGTTDVHTEQTPSVGAEDWPLHCPSHHHRQGHQGSTRVLFLAVSTSLPNCPATDH